MRYQEIINEIRKVDEEMKKTTSVYRKRDLSKYRKKLNKKLRGQQ